MSLCSPSLKYSVLATIPHNLLFGLIGAANVMSLGGYSAFIPVAITLQLGTAAYYYLQAEREPQRRNQYHYISAKFGFMTPVYLVCLLGISTPIIASVTFQVCKCIIIQVSANVFRDEVTLFDNALYLLQNIANAFVFLGFANSAKFLELAVLLFMTNFALASYRYREEPVIKNCFNANIATTTLLFLGLLALHLPPLATMVLYSSLLLLATGIAREVVSCLTEEQAATPSPLT